MTCLLLYCPKRSKTFNYVYEDFVNLERVKSVHYGIVKNVMIDETKLSNGTRQIGSTMHTNWVSLVYLMQCQQKTYNFNIL